MKTKTYKQISKGELKKYNGYKCDFITDLGKNIKDGEIHLNDDDSIYIFSNDENGDGDWLYHKKGYKYSWCIYSNHRENKYVSNNAYKEITIYLPEETFKEGEEVYVNNIDEEHALEYKDKRIFLYKDKNGNNICVWGGNENNYKEGKIYKTVICKYAVKIPKEETIETIKIKTEDGQTLEISKEKAIELGFNIN